MSVEDVLRNARSMNAHELNSTRSINGEYSTLFPQLKMYPDKFKEYMRMEVSTFEYVLSKIRPLLMKNWCNFHVQPIYPEERLVLTLRKLASFLTLKKLQSIVSIFYVCVEANAIAFVNGILEKILKNKLIFPYAFSVYQNNCRSDDPVDECYQVRFHAQVMIKIIDCRFLIVRKKANFLKIGSKEEVNLTLFLATGSTYTNLAFSFKMGIKTVSSIISETMNILWSTLAPLHMAPPTSDDFIKISEDFQKKWGMPHCLGAIDGRHVHIEKPGGSGSLYYNYKGYHSIVLQAVVDANYRYIFIDTGGYGSQHDSATFKASEVYKALIQNELDIPRPSKVEDSNLYLPYFFIGDGAYALSDFLMKPYRGDQLPHNHSVFNKRLSRARVVVENAFAHTSQKWRILYGPIDKFPEVVNLIIKCTCVLHNVILDLEREIVVPNANVEQTISLEDNDDVLVVPDDDILLVPVTGEDIRNELAKYFMQNHLCHKCALI